MDMYLRKKAINPVSMICLSVFFVLLQIQPTDIILIDKDQLILFRFIAAANYTIVNEILIVMGGLHFHAYDYIKYCGVIVTSKLFQFSSCSHLLPNQFNLTNHIDSFISFHKQTETIRSAVIAIP